MKSYKVEIKETTTYVVDVRARDEQEATDKATIEFNQIADNGTAHYYAYGDIEQEIGTVYDVSGTEDDAFACPKCGETMGEGFTTLCEACQLKMKAKLEKE